MTQYLGIDPVQVPFDLGLDDAGRSMVVFNVNAMCEHTTTFLEEIASVLVDAGVGTLGVNIFATSDATIPSGNGPYLSIIETPGAPPLHIHNQRVPAGLEQPAAQIVVRSNNYGPARTMAWAAYSALLAVINEPVTP